MHAMVLNRQRLQILTVCLRLPGCGNNSVLCMKDSGQTHPEIFSLLSLGQWGEGGFATPQTWTYVSGTLHMKGKMNLDAILHTSVADKCSCAAVGRVTLPSCPEQVSRGRSLVRARTLSAEWTMVFRVMDSIAEHNAPFHGFSAFAS